MLGVGGGDGGPVLRPGGGSCQTFGPRFHQCGDLYCPRMEVICSPEASGHRWAVSTVRGPYPGSLEPRGILPLSNVLAFMGTTGDRRAG